MITYPFNLDMVPGGKQPVVRINQYDSDFRLAFSLFARKGEFNLESGTEASIRGTKPDKNVYTAACDIDIESKIVTVTGDVQITAVAGESTFEIVLTKDGEELSSANFPIIVEKAAANKDTIQSDSVVRELVAVLDKSGEIIAAGAQYDEYKAEIESAMEEAGSIKRAAETAEDNAKSYARNASNSATEAGRKATAAAEYANDADRAKGEAAASARAAAESAEAFVVDSTLTQEGAAADASVVGKKMVYFDSEGYLCFKEALNA
ncbi:MAG: hypothetical protein E7238_00170 [Sarcina sp.]|nr:hypothetical protein [Sarcina sp.]